jgi:hypothetical protein
VNSIDRFLQLIQLRLASNLYFYTGDVLGHLDVTALIHSLRTKKPPGLAAASGFVEFLLLVLVEDLEVGAPAKEFFGGHHAAHLAEAEAEFFGDAELEHEPVVLAKLLG